MKEEILKIYRENFDNNLKAAILDSIRIGITAYSEFFNENQKFFNMPNQGTIKGRLQTYAVERQVFINTVQSKVPLTAQYKEVNTFHYQVLQLETHDFNVTLSRTNKNCTLPHAAKYRKELAKYNDEIEGQEVLEFLENFSCKEKKYAIITYGIDKNYSIEHAGIIIPDSKLKNVFEYDNLLNIPHIIQDIKINQESEEMLIKLKNEITEEFYKIKQG